MNNPAQILMLLTLLVANTTSCDMQLGSKKVIEPPPTNSAAQPGQKIEILARINGQPIYMTPLREALLEDYGLPIARWLIADEVVRQELARLKLPMKVTQEQVAAENDQMLRTMFQFAEKPSPQQMETLLSQFLAKRQNTRRQWDATMARNVRLSRIVAGQVKITQAELRKEFFRRYNGKLKVRHIQVPSLIEAETVIRELGKGRDFATTAYKFSTSPSAKTGAWLPEIDTRDATTSVPSAIIKAARALKTPGDRSNPVQVGTNFHILKLEEVLPPVDVKFEDVAAKLKTDVEYRRITQLRHQILRNLLSGSKTNIEYVNPVIRSKSRPR